MKQLTEAQREVLREAKEDEDFSGVFLVKRGPRIDVQHFEASRKDVFNMCASELISLLASMAPNKDVIDELYALMLQANLEGKIDEKTD